MIFFRRSPEFDPDEEVTLAMRFRAWTSGWRGAMVLFLLIVPALGWWKGAAVYDRIKVQRVEWLIARSEAARARGDFPEAKEKLKQALVLRRGHPATLRAVARYQVGMHEFSALNTYAQLLQTGRATMDDKVDFAREALRFGRPDLAAEVFVELQAHPETKDTATVLAIGAGQAAAEGRRAEALTLARRACARPEDDAGVVFAQSVLARLLLQPPSSAQTEGIALLCALALRPDADGLEALEMLAGLAKNPQTAALFGNGAVDVKTLIDAVERHPQAPPALQVGIWNLRLAAEPAKRAAITHAVFERYQADPRPEVRLEAGRWLNQNGMHRLALEVAEPAKLESKDWFLLYLDATAALGHWEEVARTLSDDKEKIPLTAGLRELFSLRAAIELGRRPDVAAAWREIEILARTDTVTNQLYMAGYAELIGRPVEAARLYRRLLDRKERQEDILPAADKMNRPRRLVCYTGLLRTGGEAMTLEELGALLSAFAEEFPEIDEVQNDNAYLQLLAGLSLKQAANTARRLLQKKPEMLAYRTTAALAALRQQQEAAASADGGDIDRSTAPEPMLQTAAAIYDGWSIDWSTAQDRYKAVYAAALRVAGRVREAEEIMAQINAEALRLEERKLAGLP